MRKKFRNNWQLMEPLDIYDTLFVSVEDDKWINIEHPEGQMTTLSLSDAKELRDWLNLYLEDRQ